MRKFYKIILILLAMSSFSFAQTEEDLLKAALLEKLTRFITWSPESGMKDESTPFIISVIGRDPFGKILEKIYSEQKINKKKIKINSISNPNEIDGSHILFITNSKINQIDDILSAVKNKPILTIGESEGMGERGVHLNLTVDRKGALSFEINEKKFKESGLKPDMMLLEIGKIIR